VSEPDPWLVILGGINGAGKSTLAGTLKQDARLASARFLNPDEETAAIRRAAPSLSLAIAEFRGLRVVLEEIRRQMEARRSFVTETVFANKSYLRLIESAKASGYHVSLLFVSVPSVEDSIARVADRVARGGHDVRESDIRRRWPIARQNLALAVKIADKGTVYNNSGYGKTPTVVARARSGRIEILDRAALPAVTAALET
jgi:predicted ABC-type ATPase